MVKLHRPTRRYGFRPGRNQHQALDALAFGIGKRRINWVLDADIRRVLRYGQPGLAGPFRRAPDWRSTDRRLIRKWLAAGVLEDGRLIETEEGTPQGAVISPLLANVYLHYVYDLWVHPVAAPMRHWRGGCRALRGRQCATTARM